VLPNTRLRTALRGNYAHSTPDTKPDGAMELKASLAQMKKRPDREAEPAEEAFRDSPSPTPRKRPRLHNEDNKPGLHSASTQPTASSLSPALSTRGDFTDLFAAVATAWDGEYEHLENVFDMPAVLSVFNCIPSSEWDVSTLIQHLYYLPDNFTGSHRHMFVLVQSSNWVFIVLSLCYRFIATANQEETSLALDPEDTYVNTIRDELLQKFRSYHNQVMSILQIYDEKVNGAK
jgi:hypothetical protein